MTIPVVVTDTDTGAVSEAYSADARPSGPDPMQQPIGRSAIAGRR
jgi:hypothetical protein